MNNSSTPAKYVFHKPYLLKLFAPTYHRNGWKFYRKTSIFDGKKSWFPVDFPTGPDDNVIGSCPTGGPQGATRQHSGDLIG